MKIGLTVSDSYLSLGLNKLGTNQYDTSTDLFSNDPKAVAWGERLFTYFRDRSQKMELDHLVSGT
jgi:predicted transcriptional regulator